MTETYVHVTESSVTPTFPNDMENFEITTLETIPQSSDSYIQSIELFGYAWLNSTSYPADAVVATIHPSYDDNYEYPELWHTHTISVNQNGCVVDMQEINSFALPEDNVLSIYVSNSEATVSSTTFQSGNAFQLSVNTVNCPAPLSGLEMMKYE